MVCHVLKIRVGLLTATAQFSFNMRSGLKRKKVAVPETVS